MVPWNDPTQLGFCLNSLYSAIDKTTQANSPFPQKLFLTSVRRNERTPLFLEEVLTALVLTRVNIFPEFLH